MAQRIILRKGTATAWTTANPVLAAGEPGFETDTGLLKIGDGSNWQDTPYVVDSVTLSLADLIDVAGTTPTSGQVLKFNGSEWAPAADNTGGGTGATYTISAETTTGGANLRLTGSDASTDNVKLAQGSNISITRTDGDTITIASTDTNTTYALDTVPTAETGIIRLTDSSAGTDTVTLTGTGLAQVSSDASSVTINVSNNNNTFNGTTNFDNISVNALGKITTKLIESTTTLELAPTGILGFRPTAGTVFGSITSNVNGPVQLLFNDGANATALTMQQAFEGAGAVNLEWRRSRGTLSVPTALVNNDGIGDLVWYGHDGATYAPGASINAFVSGSITTPGQIPTVLRFGTSNGTSVNYRAEITPTGVFRTNAIQALTLNGNLVFTNNGTGKVQLPAGTTVGGVAIGTLTFAGSVANAAARALLTPSTGQVYIQLDDLHGYLWDGAAWVDLGVIQGPAGTDGADGADGQGVPVGGTEGQVLAKIDGTDYNTEWVTPSLVGELDDLSDVTITGTPSDGQVLKYDSGTSQWVNAEDATATIFERSSVSGTSSALADGVAGPINITGFKSYALLKIQVDEAAWVRIYTSEAARIADASRLEGTDPAPGAGIIAEVITTGAETIVISPGTIGFNDEGTVTTNVPCRVTNKSGTTTAITVTLTLIKLEV